MLWVMGDGETTTTTTLTVLFGLRRYDMAGGFACFIVNKLLVMLFVIVQCLLETPAKKLSDVFQLF